LPETGLGHVTVPELILLVVAGVFTLVVATFLIVTVVRHQLREPPAGESAPRYDRADDDT